MLQGEKNDYSFQTDIFKKFQRQWAVITAGSAEKNNSMLVAWGSMGTLWEKPVVTVYAAHSHYTHQFLTESEYFTVSFFPNDLRKRIVKFGTKSGRDTDKNALAGVTPRFTEHGLTFEEAESAIICRKLYADDFELAKLPPEIAKIYPNTNEIHTMFIGEVVELIQK
ncbi:flavin reductase [Ruminococcus flavefaciens]